MKNNSSRWCVFLPCSRSEVWAIPQNCLAEIVTVNAPDQTPPSHIEWRGVTVPVLDLDEEQSVSWRDERRNTGMVAVILGLAGEGCDYWGIALRGDGLGMTDIADAEIEDLPDMAHEGSSGAFRMQGMVYQVPDLLGLQKQMGTSLASA